MIMDTQGKLTLFLSEARDWALARCPEFKINAFADSKDEAKQHLFENVRTASYVIVNRKKKGLPIDEKLFPFADIINNNGANIKQYFTETPQ